MAWTVRQYAISWAYVDPDLCCHMASLDHNEWQGELTIFIEHNQIITDSKNQKSRINFALTVYHFMCYGYKMVSSDPYPPPRINNPFWQFSDWRQWLLSFSSYSPIDFSERAISVIRFWMNDVRWGISLICFVKLCLYWQILTWINSSFILLISYAMWWWQKQIYQAEISNCILK